MRQRQTCPKAFTTRSACLARHGEATLPNLAYQRRNGTLVVVYSACCNVPQIHWGFRDQQNALFGKRWEVIPFLERVYRLLYNPDLYLMAYGKIYRNNGAMTKGTTEETADGMSRAKIATIIEAIRQERYRWKPARRTYIPKKDGRKRPLGIQSWSDKLLQPHLFKEYL